MTSDTAGSRQVPRDSLEHAQPPAPGHDHAETTRQHHEITGPPIRRRSATDSEADLRQQMDAGDTDAARRLAILLARTGRSTEGQQVLRHAVLAGDSRALLLLALLLQQEGRAAEASLLSVYWLAEDGSTAIAWQLRPSPDQAQDDAARSEEARP